MPAEDAQRVGPLQVAVFLDELALLVVLAVAGARIGGGAVASTLRGDLLPLAAAVIWGLWLAPARPAPPRPSSASGGEARPGRNRARLLLALSGAVWWGVAFFVVSAALITRRGARGTLSGRGSA